MNGISALVILFCISSYARAENAEEVLFNYYISLDKSPLPWNGPVKGICESKNWDPENYAVETASITTREISLKDGEIRAEILLCEYNYKNTGKVVEVFYFVQGPNNVIYELYNHVISRHTGGKLKIFERTCDNRPSIYIFAENRAIPVMTAARLGRYAAYLNTFNYDEVAGLLKKAHNKHLKWIRIM